MRSAPKAPVNRRVHGEDGSSGHGLAQRGGTWMPRGAGVITGPRPGADPEAETLAHSLPV